jgi:hypothetical protein
MRRHALLGIGLLLPLLFVMTASSGCGKKPQKDGDGGDDDKLAATTKARDAQPKENGKPTGGGKVALKADSFDGLIRGQVVYDGSPPEAPPVAKMKENPDKNHCLSGPESAKIEQTWIVNKKTNGVANAVVFLKAPAGQYFPLDQNVLGQFTKEVSIDQPFCAFVPHVQVAFPYYWDGKKYVPSGQVFKIKNSAPVPHNSKITGDEKDVYPGNPTLQPKGEAQVEFKRVGRRPVNLNCGFHPWMNAMIWSFDHPYAAITDEDGKFELKNVPTGVELTLGAWHESLSSTELKTFHNEPVNLKKGETLEMKPLKIKGG